MPGKATKIDLDKRTQLDVRCQVSIILKFYPIISAVLGLSVKAEDNFALYSFMILG